ncbi:hypothetical protein CoNPh33_CDS0023 [Staphylococcus phage S-CoN_Ph33]|nr:hypothetical protein CoNPh33_CDS0023 [Staphylococcus phage S-CoN_Ph33]
MRLKCSPKRQILVVLKMNPFMQHVVVKLLVLVLTYLVTKQFITCIMVVGYLQIKTMDILPMLTLKHYQVKG